jgi:chromosome segregation ATPase
LHKSKIADLEAERREWESARLRLEVEDRDLQLRLEAGSRQYQDLRERTALLEGRAEAAELQFIEVTHCLGSLLDEMDQMRGELRRVTAERDGERNKRETWIGFFRGSRLRALWHDLAEKCPPLYRGGPIR